MKNFISTIVLAALWLTAGATPVLSPLFSDNMVLQQHTNAPIWGTAKPGKTVTVTPSWGGATVAVKAGKDGRWKAEIATPKAGGPYTVTVSDGKAVTLNNVMIGEVWLCSGQSNMEYPVKGWTSVLNADDELARADVPGIRLLQIRKIAAEQPQADVVANSATWQMCNARTLPEFSAVAYFFARRLHEELGVPVAVIDATWGGSNIESWISGGTLSAIPEYADSVSRKDYGPWRNSPAALYNGMIHPLVPMALRGFCWYQGEQNELRGWQYRDLFTMLIRDWRLRWQNDELPFYYVQLANFHERHSEPVEAQWAELREAQDMALRLPHTGQVITTDVGLGHDVHYPNKQEVGRRLSLIALADTYGRDVVYSGPRYESYSIEGNRIALRFSHTDGGLKQHGKELTEFAIAGLDHKYHKAKARIVGDRVMVWSDEVEWPVAVRYAWQDNPEVTLYNGAGLPAAPFRTDDWPLTSFGKTRGNSEY